MDYGLGSSHFSLIQREIKKEIERRKTGKEMLDYKRKQEEELAKRMLEERSREKAEDRAARERIKQQIALVSFAVCSFIHVETVPFCVASRIPELSELNQLSAGTREVSHWCLPLSEMIDPLTFAILFFYSG